MQTVCFLHQKGGTGKSTLAISTALALAARGESVVLLDADYQGTTSEWGNRFGVTWGIETRSQVQPIIHEEKKRFEKAAHWLIVDGPPSLSPMTESILRASDKVIIPCRPSRPDVWALPWLAAIITKLSREGKKMDARVVFNMVREEDLAPFHAEVERLKLAVHDQVIPADGAFMGVFDGQPLPEKWQQILLEMVAAG